MRFDHERLTVYGTALQFLILAAGLAEEWTLSGCAFLGDQLRRAAALMKVPVPEVIASVTVSVAATTALPPTS